MTDSSIAGGRGAPAMPDDPDSVAAAEQVALRILQGAAQSAGALQRRLQRRGFSAEAATAATAAMSRRGYVDDTQLAASIAARGQRTGHGRIQVAAQLRARGIDDDDVAVTLAAVDLDAERATALALAARLFDRSNADTPALDRRRRVFRQLQRRGFDNDTAHWVLRQLEHPD